MPVSGSTRGRFHGGMLVFQTSTSGFDSRSPLRSNAQHEYIQLVLSCEPLVGRAWSGPSGKAGGCNPPRGQFDPDPLLLLR